jgi:two-component system chemotaxis response regulator CheB
VPTSESLADGLPGRIYRRAFDIVVIGISTGGPQALRSLVPRLPVDLPVPVLIVMHMPVGYTEAYARRLGELSHLAVKEAADGDLLLPGQVLLARAGYHLRIARNGAGRVEAMLDWEPSTLHRPSIDVLFRSAAEMWGARVLGVVMTGMGADGREGAAWIKGAGGTVLTEAEDSCVVYGMPRSVVEAGLSDASCTLEAMPRAILERL